jgi:Family of unknown function (DUF6339)
MKARFFKEKYLKELELNIAENLELYRAGSFDLEGNNTDNYFEAAFEIDEGKLKSLLPSNKNEAEVQNCMLIFEAMLNLTHFHARDARLWVYLTHTVLLPYSRARWVIPADNLAAIKFIKDHFFCIANRGIERNNAASRLWWLAALCNRTQGLSLKDALTTLLYQSDVRASIIERPTTSQCLNIFSAVLRRLNESYHSDKKLFERSLMREAMKKLNLAGGVKLLGVLPEQQVNALVTECMS